MARNLRHRAHWASFYWLTGLPDSAERIFDASKHWLSHSLRQSQQVEHQEYPDFQMPHLQRALFATAVGLFYAAHMGYLVKIPAGEQFSGLFAWVARAGSGATHDRTFGFIGASVIGCNHHGSAQRGQKM